MKGDKKYQGNGSIGFAPLTRMAGEEHSRQKE